MHTPTIVYEKITRRQNESGFDDMRVIGDLDWQIKPITTAVQLIGDFLNCQQLTSLILQKRITFKYYEIFLFEKK